MDYICSAQTLCISHWAFVMNVGSPHSAFSNSTHLAVVDSARHSPRARVIEASLTWALSRAELGLFPDRLDHCFNSALFVLVFDPRRKGPRRYATAEVLFIIKKGLRFAAIKISGCAIRFMRRAGAVDMIQFPLNLDSLSHSGLEKVIII